MAAVELIMPKMGESIIEATILSWSKQVGDTVDIDETVLEIATDKVDSEVPSPVAGVLSEIRFEVDAVVPVGEVIAIINTGGEAPAASAPKAAAAPAAAVLEAVSAPLSGNTDAGGDITRIGGDGRFFSPLVRKIANEEGLSQAELESIPGSGHQGRVNKSDILSYLKNRGTAAPVQAAPAPAPAVKRAAPKPASIPLENGNEVIEMDRMRRLIADHMVNSLATSPHVTSFVEADVTNVWNWREANKKSFQQRYGDKITFTPIFFEAVVKAIADYPMINVSVDGTKIIVKKKVNIGMAAALPSGNLIVPVIKEANLLSLPGLAKNVNDLASRARANKLKPEEIQGGTFTITNVGTFGNVMGTPIINQPQVAILATGAIRKRPAVLETEHGDVIAIRHMMFLSLSYDHRVVDGALGGSFLRRIADYLEQFDPKRTV
ncbi:MAG: dihydrolipoamide acetyltransferase family protein [Saprospiraceae bacterium]